MAPGIRLDREFLLAVVRFLFGYEVGVQNFVETLSDLVLIVNLYDLDYFFPAKAAHIILLDRIDRALQTHASVTTIQVNAVGWVGKTNVAQTFVVCAGEHRLIVFFQINLLTLEFVRVYNFLLFQ